MSTALLHLTLAFVLGYFSVNALAQEKDDRSAPPPAAVIWPDTIAAVRAKAYIAALNADGDDAMRAFIETHRSPDYRSKKPMEQRLDEARQLRSQIAPLEVGAIRPESDRVVEVIARSTRLNMWMSFRVELEEAPPHYIAGVRAQATSSPLQTVPDYADVASLEELVTRVRKDTGTPALAIGVIRGDRPANIAIEGVRRIDAPGEVSQDDRFHIGSVGKAMTATLIGRLIENGNMTWDTALSRSFDDIPMRSQYKEATFEQALQHRAGFSPMSPFPADDVVASGTPVQQRIEFVRLALNEEPIGRPGETWKYANADYVAVACAVEKITGLTYEQLMNEHVFAPLGMTRAGFGWPSDVDLSEPSGHVGTPPTLRVQKPSDIGLGAFLRPAGDLHCSIRDLSAFAVLHLRGLRGHDGVLKSDTVRRLHAPLAEPRSGEVRCASGWMIEDWKGNRVHFHVGSAMTFYAIVVVGPDDDCAIVAVANSGTHVDAFVKSACAAALANPGLEP